MIRVAHVVTAYSSAVTILAPKLNALRAYQDIDVTVVTGPRAANETLPDPPVRHIEAPIVRPIQPLADFNAVRRLTTLLARERFDIVHSHTSKAGVITALAGSRANVPLILHTYHGIAFYDGQPPLQYHMYRLFERIACRRRHHVFSQNQRDMQACIDLMGAADRVSYEGNGVDVDDVRNRADAYRNLAQRDYPPGRVRLALVSRLEPVKRVDTFIDVCDCLTQRGVDVSAVIAGPGRLETALRHDIVARNLSRKVRLLGWSSRVPSVLALADIVILTSEKEGVPRALMEAMALRKPVVATDVPGTQELVVDGETGFLTPLSDTQAMATRVEQLARDETLRTNMGDAGYHRVQQQFNDRKIAAFLHDFYVSRHRGA